MEKDDPNAKQTPENAHPPIWLKHRYTWRASMQKARKRYFAKGGKGQPWRERKRLKQAQQYESSVIPTACTSITKEDRKQQHLGSGDLSSGIS